MKNLKINLFFFVILIFAINFVSAQKIRTLNLKFIEAICYNEGTGEPVFVFKDLKNHNYFRLEEIDFNNSQNNNQVYNQLRNCLQSDCNSSKGKCTVKGKIFILTQKYLGKDELGYEIWQMIKLRIKK